MTIDELKLFYSEKTLIDLSNDTSSNVINSDVVNKLIEVAEQLINGYVKNAYRDKDGFKDLFDKMVADVVVYELFKRRGVVPDYVLRNYERIIDLLKDFANKKLYYENRINKELIIK